MIVAWNGRSGRGPSQRSQSRPAGGADSGGMADPRGSHVAGEGRACHGDLAQCPGVHRLGKLRVHPRRPAVNADLDDPVVLPRRLDHRPALDDRHRQRLLDVDVLARVAGGDHLDGVPVVGRGDHDGVDILAIEDRAEILDAGDVPFDLRHLGDAIAQAGEPRVEPIVSPVEVRLVDVAERHDLGIRMRQEALQELAAAIAHADEAQPDPFVGPEPRGPAPGSRPSPRSRRATAVFENARRSIPCDMLGASIEVCGVE